MFRIFAVLPVIFILSACGVSQQADTATIEQLKIEVDRLKQNQTQIARRVGLGELVRPNAIEMAEGIKTGNSDAKVAIIEFTDLHCPFCKRFHQETYPELKAQFIDTNKLLFVARELPLPKLHPNAGMAAVALRCSAQQNAYAQVKDSLFEAGNAGFNQSYLDSFGEQFEIDQEQLNECFKDRAVHAAVTISSQYAQEMGFSGTPVFIIGRVDGDQVTDYEIVSGAKDFEHFANIINKYL